MKSSFAKFALVLGALALATCRPDPLGSTGVQLDLITKDPRLLATSFNLTWMDEHGQLLMVRVPEQGVLDPAQAPTVSVFISMTPDKVGMRRVLVYGYRDDTLISEGAARLFTSADYWSQLGVPMVAFGTLPDADGDGLPDAVDNCPHERDPCGSSAADAGAPDDAGSDGGDDATPAPDLAPLPDSPSVLPTSLDAGTDVRPS